MRPSRLRFAWVALSVLLTAASGAAQQRPEPRLLHRTSDAADPDESGIYRAGRSSLSIDASGSYALNPDGNETIEIILSGDDGQLRLQGYVTRLGDGPSDRGTPLTYFFARTTVSPTGITFVTRPVHGAWWSFTGTIDQGTAQMSTQKGFYFLNGTLTEHFDGGSEQQQRISLPSLPEGHSQP